MATATKKGTGLLDKNGREIVDGDRVSLDGNMTADDTLSFALPNGWTFDKDDVYEVYLDEGIGKWSLKLGIKPDTAYNCKLLNHSLSLLHGGLVEVVET